MLRKPRRGRFRIDDCDLHGDHPWPRLLDQSEILLQVLLERIVKVRGQHLLVFAGSAEAAFKATDSSTGQLLAESVDKRVGGMAVSSAAQVQWGDAQTAMDYWAQRITVRAVSLGAGTPTAATQPSASN
jgi:hypothetical protein